MPYWSRRLLHGVGLVIVLALVFLWLGVALAEQGGKRGRDKVPKGSSGVPAQNLFFTNVPAHPLDLILGRPTRDSVTLNVLAWQDIEGCLAYGVQPGKYSSTTPTKRLKKGQPEELVIGSLQPNTRYYYQFRSRPDPHRPFNNSPEYTFHTQRSPGMAFTFTVTADSHLDERTNPALYQQTMINALADSPDFHIDLGDTFMTEKHNTREKAARQYLAQRYYFGLLGHSAPVFLALGNHDGESSRERDGTPRSPAVWANAMRKRYFPNPVPDNFYTGNATKDPFAGLLQDYYAWEWGDALFIVLDPYWFASRQRGGSDNWNRSLGAEQYRWLKHALEQSSAKFKFVFIHHLVGSGTREGRGGAEAAKLFEWGGCNADGSDGFREHRPDWPAPIHQLLVQNHASIVFHGHDHFFAKQDLDGIVYQLVPQPGLQRYGTARNAQEYGYIQGVILGGAGHLRIRVDGAKAKVDYVLSCLPADENTARQNGVVAYSYAAESHRQGS